MSNNIMIEHKIKRIPFLRCGLLPIWLSIFLAGFDVSAQTFNGQGGVLIPPGAPVEDVGITLSPVTVSGIGVLGEGCMKIDNVTMDVLHTWTGDIALFLISPNGLVLELSSGNGGSGDNYSITVFTDLAPLFITQGMSPFNATFRPEGRQQNTDPPFSNANPLGTYTFQNTFQGIDADGDWQLLVNDYFAGDVGIINSWSITFSSGNGPFPEVTLGPDITICSGQVSTLTADASPSADQYLWSTGESSSSIVVSPPVSTTYSVMVTYNGCIDRDTIQVFVEPNTVVADAGPDLDVCLTESTALTGSGGGSGSTYTWSTGQTGAMITVNPSMTTTYTLTVSDGVCSATDEVVVNVTPLPVANAGPDVEICAGEFIDLGASGGIQNDDYSWSSGQSGSSISINPSETTNYTVTVDVNGCIDTDEILVTVFEAPEVDAGPDEEICLGDNITLIASGSDGSYTWSNGQSGDEITISPVSATTYEVTLTANGCEATDEVWVNVISVQADAGPNQIICDGASITLMASGGTEYQWSTGQTQPSISVSPTSTTNYFVTVSEGNCFVIASVEVEVVPLPVADAGPDQFIGSGGSAVLNASGGNTYVWSTGETTPQISVSPLVTTTYMVTVTIGSCSSVDEVIVYVDQVPLVDLGPDFVICEGETVSIDAFIPGPFTLTYLWSTGQTDSLINVAPLVDSNYSVTVLNVQTGISSMDTIHVTVHHPPVGIPVISGPGTICEGDTITYFALAVSDVSLYQWDAAPDGMVLSGQGTQTVEVLWPTSGSGQLQLIVSNLCGALPVVFFDQEIEGPPILQGPLSGETNPCAEGSYLYTIPGIINATDYQWSLSGQGTILSGQGTNTVDIDWNNSAGGDLCVVASNPCGTSASLCLAIQTVATPVLSAGPDLSACGQTIMLEGSGVGGWTLVSGPGTAVFSLPDDPGSLVTVTQPGTYLFHYLYDLNGCFAEDETLVRFFETPAIIGVEALCSGALSDYTVSFDIVGGQSPYMVNSQSISGAAFQSAAISAGDSYSFQVIDANGCLSQEVTGMQECDCITNAGTMSSLQVSACVGEKATVSYLGGGMYDMDDTLAFVLHDGNFPDGIVYWSSLPDIGFVAGMVPDQVYYVSAVVGRKGINGLPDLADPCLSFSNAEPIVFYSLPVAMTIEAAWLGCDPQNVMLDIGQSDTGHSFSYFWSVFDGGTILGPDVGAMVTAVSAGNYVLMVENTTTGCISSDTIAVIPASLSIEELKLTITPPLCPGDCNGMISLSNINEAWLYDFGNGVYTQDTVSDMICSGQFLVSVKDTLGCVSDTLVKVEEPIGVMVDLGPDQTIKLGDQIELYAHSGSMISQYNWFGADTCMNCSSILVKPLTSIIYTVEVLDQNGCSAEDQISITVAGNKALAIPNIFSPNGDQVNDILYIGENSRIQTIQLFEIFDRWGNLILHREDVTPGDIAQGWDGTFKGRALNEGVYTLRIIVQFYDDDIIHSTSDATLIR